MRRETVRMLLKRRHARPFALSAPFLPRGGSSGAVTRAPAEPDEWLGIPS